MVEKNETRGPNEEKGRGVMHKGLPDSMGQVTQQTGMGYLIEINWTCITIGYCNGTKYRPPLNMGTVRIGYPLSPLRRTPRGKDTMKRWIQRQVRRDRHVEFYQLAVEWKSLSFSVVSLVAIMEKELRFVSVLLCLLRMRTASGQSARGQARQRAGHGRGKGNRMLRVVQNDDAPP